jgi:hypothetical protein
MLLSGVLHRLRLLYWRNDVPRINKTSYGIAFAAMAPIFAILAFGILISVSMLLLECGLHSLLQKLQ